MTTIAHRIIHREILAVFLLALLAIGAAAQPSAETGRANVLTSDTDVATAGYFQLRWDAAEPIRLLESTSREFADATLVYTGSDSGHMVSGRADGDLWFRLESAATGAALGDPVHVVIAHHSLGRALAFFTVGALVFVATLAMILIAGRESAR
jgi:hypothetical protein